MIPSTPTDGIKMMNRPFEGPITRGAIFRHVSFDVSCRVKEVTGHYVIASPICTDPVVESEEVSYRAENFRRNWQPDPDQGRRCK